MAAAALGLFVVLVLLAGGLRTWIQLRRTGDSGSRQSKLSTGQWWVGPFATLPGVAAPVAELLGIDPISLFDHQPLRIGGAILAALGILLVFGAQMAMGDSWRIGVDEAERTELVTAGPFRLVRNPIFTAVLVAVTGLALMVPNWISVAGLALLLLGIEVEVRRIEEPYLRRIHGDDYRSYAGRVGRFLPGLGRTRSDKKL
jgi:protein-S-isoprenylcysteine O-methyltransferase Ste14